MADKHPYISASGAVIQAVNQLRSAFPQQISADTFKKLGIAPNNESYVMNILRFIQTIDSEGKKTAKASSTFSKHDNGEFQTEFAEMVKEGYTGLFSLYGDAGWTVPTDKLISYFRGSDQTSSIVGKRQAATFQTLAGLAGKIDTTKQASATVTVKKSPAKQTAVKTTNSPKKPQTKPETGIASQGGTQDRNNGNHQAVGLTVRIEINLPIAPDQATYDRIFKSIKENLLNG